MVGVARSEAFDWMNIAIATMALGAESASVIGLRAAKASEGGPKAAAEAWRMYSEKVASLAELQTRFLAGSLGATPLGTAQATLKHYRGKVAANRRRLRQS
jgi:hypothetical protein